jgi:hypothetical protein
MAKSKAERFNAEDAEIGAQRAQRKSTAEDLPQNYTEG